MKKLKLVDFLLLNAIYSNPKSIFYIGTEFMELLVFYNFSQVVLSKLNLKKIRV